MCLPQQWRSAAHRFCLGNWTEHVCMLLLCALVTTNPATRLFGPFPLTLERIDHNLQAASPGVFALGEERGGLFVIQYIGRSDGDLRSTLKAHVGGRYRLFKFRYALSALDAFGKEC